ncbi:MAG: hypothetical protein AAAC47_01770 [Pararhizobium sp.]
MPTYPTADQVARAIVAACELTAENPLMITEPSQLHARHYAFAALKKEFPNVQSVILARCVGYPQPRKGYAYSMSARHEHWWRDMITDDVLGALVADQYGDRAK